MTHFERRQSVNGVARRRWLVHVALIVGFVAAALSPIFLSRKYLGHSGTTDHVLISLLVLAVIAAHLVQRRLTVKRLCSHLIERRREREVRPGLAQSDLLLSVLTVNAMVSGVADYLMGHPIYLRVPGPYILQKWHALSALVLLGYVVTHVTRRRGRLRRSQIK